jgi:hypothetical protein
MLLGTKKLICFLFYPRLFYLDATLDEILSILFFTSNVQYTRNDAIMSKVPPRISNLQDLYENITI